MNTKITDNQISLFEEKYIFLDFDGVIKDSVEVKTDAFLKLFSIFGEKITKKVKIHHEENGGISRYDKIPLYLEWAGEKVSSDEVTNYSDEFSKLVKQEVVQSKWVPGILSFLQKQSESKVFFIVTATPQEEIEEVVMALELKKYFKEIIGAPTTKIVAIKEILEKYAIATQNAIMVGDSITDYNAAIKNNIKFMLRKTKLNKIIQKQLQCQMIIDFNDE
jgi:phosphoglycolate phosphatase-like HAD superfamily hydrolase